MVERARTTSCAGGEGRHGRQPAQGRVASGLDPGRPGEAIGDWGKFAYDQAKSEALKAIGRSGSGELDTDDLNELRSAGADSAQQVVIDQLLAAGYFDPPPPDSTVNDSGVPVFDTESQEYHQWILDNAPVAEIRAVVITAFGLEPR